MLNEQAERHGAQVFAAKANRQTVSGRVLLRCQGCVDACCQCGAQCCSAVARLAAALAGLPLPLPLPLPLGLTNAPLSPFTVEPCTLLFVSALRVAAAEPSGCTTQSTKRRLPSRRSARQIANGLCCRMPSSTNLSRTIGEIWFTRAGEVTVGAGNHKDYHMTQPVDWLILACGTSLDDLNSPWSRSSIVRWRSLEEMVHGEPAKICCATYAIERPTELRDLQYEIIDRDLLNLTLTLEALLLGAADACASVSLLVAAFCELLALIDTGSTTDIALAILHLAPRTQRVEVAKELATNIRVNSHPRQRATVARALQDALGEDGLGPADFGSRLEAGRDDSSEKSSLYLLATGELLTSRQMAARLLATRRIQFCGIRIPQTTTSSAGGMRFDLQMFPTSGMRNCF